MHPTTNNRTIHQHGKAVRIGKAPENAVRIGKAPENAVRIGKAPKNAVPVAIPAEGVDKSRLGGAEKQKLTREEFEKLQAKINRQSQNPKPAFGADEFIPARPAGNSKLTLGAQRR